MKHTLFILALLTASVSTFAQSPRIKLNQITKDSLAGSVLISSPTDSGMVYSRDLFISYGADTFLILGADTIVLQSDLIAEIGDSLLNYVSRTELSDSTTNIRTDIPLIIADSLLNYVNISGTQTITGAKTFTSDVEIDGKLDLEAVGLSVFIGNNAGAVDDGSDNRNVGVGYQALRFNTSGNNNTANGYAALYSNTTGNQNTANGSLALYYNTSGNYNTANGYQALRFNTSGYRNIASGNEALFTNTSGYQNTANGYKTLYSNTTGYRNTANGNEALYSNTTGYHNTANGSFALFTNTTGYQNTANGYQALRFNTTGYHNTANGYQALRSNTTGSNNTASGYQTLYSNTTGSNNAAIGYESGRYTSTGANNTDSDNSVFIGYDSRPLADAQINQIVIGSEARGLGSNTVVIGDTNIVTTRLQGDVGIGTDSPSYDLEVVGKIYASDSIISNVYAGTSDIRLKQDIEPTDKGLDAVMELNPVSYRFIANANSEKKSYGFIAQEIEKVIPDVVGTRHDGMKVLNYNDLISVLTKAIQEQQIIIEELNQRLTILENK